MEEKCGDGDYNDGDDDELENFAENWKETTIYDWRYVCCARLALFSGMTLDGEVSCFISAATRRKLVEELIKAAKDTNVIIPRCVPTDLQVIGKSHSPY
jgi:hypothetical protein